MTQSSAELFRRAVVLPETRDALLELQSDQITNPEPFKVAEFSDDEQFYRMWKTEVFLELNRQCGLMITDYESTEVKNCFDMVSKLLEDAANQKGVLEEDRLLLQRMADLTNTARATNTSLFFVF